MFERRVNLQNLLKKSSFYLFGPRATGKSFLIRHQLKNFNYINLLDGKTYLRLKANPSELNSMVTAEVIAIDEIQRIPELLNQVHLLIEEHGKTFLLTGSSARKLRRGGANLLAGRAYQAELYPLTWKEINQKETFDLHRYLLVGGLPRAYQEANPWDFLYAYIDTYLKEEIQAEALSRNLPNFTRFLQQAAMRSSDMLNYTKVANDAQISPNTTRDYYQILEDTLVGYTLPPWSKSTKRKAIQTAKFYLFDIGITNALRNVQSIAENTDYFGKAFEHMICNEIKSYLSYERKRLPLQYWRSKSQMEVDFVIGDNIAIEVKASHKVSERDHKGLKALKEEHENWKHLLVISQDTQRQKFETGIEHIYWEEFFDLLWKGKIIN